MNSIKQILSIITLIASLYVPAIAVAADSKDKYEGIEITVNINTASAQELADLLKGVGLKKAEQIVEYRQQNGKFATADDLDNVPGIGAATVEKNRQRIQL